MTLEEVLAVNIDANKRMLESYRRKLSREGYCLDCDSSAHDDGSVIHAEDCSIPYVEKAVGE